MRILFDGWHWKEIMQRAGGFIVPCEDGKYPSLNYIRLVCQNNYCTAFASDANGYTYCSLRVPCKMEDQCPVSFFVKPDKTPPKTNEVRVETPIKVDNVYLVKIHYFVLPFEQSVDSIQTIPAKAVELPAEFEKNLKKLIETQKQEYFISYRLDVLQRALSAFKGREKDCALIFHFGTQVQPAIIETYKNDSWPETRVAICPNRIFNYDGGIRK